MTKHSTTQREKARWSPEIKTNAVNRILAGEASFSDVQRELKVQSYQLLAWLGQATLDKQSTTSANDDSEQTRELIAAVVQAAITGERAAPEAERRIVEWYLRRHLFPQR